MRIQVDVPSVPAVEVSGYVMRDVIVVAVSVQSSPRCPVIILRVIHAVVVNRRGMIDRGATASMEVSVMAAVIAIRGAIGKTDGDAALGLSLIGPAETTTSKGRERHGGDQAFSSQTISTHGTSSRIRAIDRWRIAAG
jgi:hypothetical protein